MGIFEDIRNMQGEGKSDQDIVLLLQENGYGMKEISDAVAQSKIKDAVSSQDPSFVTQSQNNDQEMMQSIAGSSQSDIPQPSQPAQADEDQQTQGSPQDQYQQPYEQYSPQQAQQQPVYQEGYANADYSQYQQYDDSSNADIMTEIAEQIVAEKLSAIRKQLEFIVDLKNTTDAKILSMDERLKRLEKIIDRIQLSILQKVGEYVSNVEDIKKEIVETQKSFKSLVSSKPHKVDSKSSDQKDFS